VAPVCRMVEPGGTDFRKIDINAKNEKGESLASFTMTREDCAREAAK
jgi:hypothetical protein